MVHFNRFLGCCLVGFFGLVSFTASADQGLALESCNDSKSYILSKPLSNGYYYDIQRGCTSYSQNTSQGMRSGFALAIVIKSSAGSVSANTVSLITGSPALLPGVSRAGSNLDLPSTANGHFFFYSTTNQSCSTRPLTYNIRAPGPNGSGNVCDLGCVMSIAISASGDPPVAEYEGAPTGSTCTPGEFPEPVIFDPSDTDGDGFPNETDPCPTDPENACVIPEVDQDDDGIPDNMDPCPSDPTNQCSGTDTPTDPENPGGGGFDCVSPPVCGSSGGLSCSQLYQSWASRCASERAADNTEGLGDSLDGIRDGLGDLGDALDASLDALGDRVVDAVNAGTNATNAVKNAVDGVKDSVDGLRGDLSTMLDGSGVETPSYGSFFGTKVLSAEQLDTAGLGLPRSCSTWDDIVFPLPGGSSFTIPLSQSTFHCDIFELTSYIVLAMSAYFALLILMRP